MCMTSKRKNSRLLTHTCKHKIPPRNKKKSQRRMLFLNRSVNISSSSCNIIMDSLWKMCLKPIKPLSPSRISSFSSLHRSSYLPSKRWFAFFFFRGHLPKNEGEEMVEPPTGGVNNGNKKWMKCSLKPGMIPIGVWYFLKYILKKNSHSMPIYSTLHFLVLSSVLLGHASWDILLEFHQPHQLDLGYTIPTKRRPGREWSIMKRLKELWGWVPAKNPPSEYW